MTENVRKIPRQTKDQPESVDLTWIPGLPPNSQQNIKRLALDLAADPCGLQPRDVVLLTDCASVLEDIRRAKMLSDRCFAAGDVAAWTKITAKVDSSRRLMTSMLAEVRQGHRAAVLTMVEAGRTDQAKAQAKAASHWAGIL